MKVTEGLRTKKLLPPGERDILKNELAGLHPHRSNPVAWSPSHEKERLERELKVELRHYQPKQSPGASNAKVVHIPGAMSKVITHKATKIADEGEETAETNEAPPPGGPG